MARLSDAQIDALDSFAQSGGHGFGEFSGITRPTALMLARAGLVTIGSVHRSGRSFPWGIATQEGVEVLRSRVRYRTVRFHNERPYGFTPWDSIPPVRRGGAYTPQTPRTFDAPGAGERDTVKPRGALSRLFFPDRTPKTPSPEAGRRLAKPHAAYRRTGKHFWYAITSDGLDMSVGRYSKTVARKKAQDRATQMNRGRIVRLYHLDQPSAVSPQSSARKRARDVERDADRRYLVYVAEVPTETGTTYYVGSTAKALPHRRIQHRRGLGGHRRRVSRIRKVGVYPSRTRAEKAERIIADRLRRRGLDVESA